MKSIKQRRFEVVEYNLQHEQKILFNEIRAFYNNVELAYEYKDAPTLTRLSCKGKDLLQWAAALLKAFKKLYYSDNGKKYLLDGTAVIDNLSDVYKNLLDVVYF